jgi:hypothetical protein
LTKQVLTYLSFFFPLKQHGEDLISDSIPWWQYLIHLEMSFGFKKCHTLPLFLCFFLGVVPSMGTMLAV